MATIQQRGSQYLQALFNAVPTQAQIDRAKAAFSRGLPPDVPNAQIIEVMLREGREAFMARLEQREVEVGIDTMRNTKRSELEAAFPVAPE